MPPETNAEKATRLIVAGEEIVFIHFLDRTVPFYPDALTEEQRSSPDFVAGMTYILARALLP